ncbi:MAG: transcription elongation factor GreA [Kofleriaceae bacterium]|nr:transcription elongation factor GreA [Kofleriaceae bacterium]
MADKRPMTPAGHALLKAQLKQLKEVDRIANARAIEVARGHGDLSENADYDAAKNEQGLIIARIGKVNTLLALAEVIDPSVLSGDRVMFGATVTYEDEDNGDEKTYTIVGEHEADLKKSRIAITSPIARALIGKEVGDTAKVRAPGGNREVEIVKVEWLLID